MTPRGCPERRATEARILCHVTSLHRVPAHTLPREVATNSANSQPRKSSPPETRPARHVRDRGGEGAAFGSGPYAKRKRTLSLARASRSSPDVMSGQPPTAANASFVAIAADEHTEGARTRLIGRRTALSFSPQAQCRVRTSTSPD
jgi:hypothetical protein